MEDSPHNRERCLKDLIAVGIDFPNYPQLIEMGEQFLDELAEQNCGIVKGDGGYMLKEKEIGEPASPPGLEPYKWTVDHLKSKEILNKIKLKSSVTGPFTLASYIKIRSGTSLFNTAISDIEIVRQLANILSESCRVCAENSYMISIDEPILSVIIGRRIFFKYGEEDIIRIYNELRRSCRNRLVGTHICGTISPRLAGMLLDTELDFLSHEFHDTPENFKVYDPERVSQSGKILSIGCVSSRNPKIEDVEEILGIMERSKQYGEDLIFTPDCGFKNLKVDGSRERGYRTAMKKLTNLVEAAKKFRAKYT
ncbi:MAG: uroporphyrinogen decarboxylase family protein [Candidatus Bathyarchaeia archaeon]